MRLIIRQILHRKLSPGWNISIQNKGVTVRLCAPNREGCLACYCRWIAHVWHPETQRTFARLSGAMPEIGHCKAQTEGFSFIGTVIAISAHFTQRVIENLHARRLQFDGESNIPEVSVFVGQLQLKIRHRLVGNGIVDRKTEAARRGE